jgi:hypothetical protein
MSEIRMSTGTATWLNEPTRDFLALGIWFAVLGGLLLLSVNGQSILMTIGFMLELTAAYSTFLLCGKQNCRAVAHVMPYVFAPDFRNTVEASLAFLVVTALMHGFVVYGVRSTPVETEEAEIEETAYAGAA